MKKCILITVVVSMILLSTGFALAQKDNYLVAAACIIDGREKEAINILNEVIEKDSNNNELLLLRAKAYYQAGDYEPAINDLTKVEEGQGNCFLWLARCYAAKGENEKAVSFLKKHLASDDKKAESEIMLDTAFSKLERTTEWRMLWRKDWYSAYERAKADIGFRIQQKEYDKALNNVNILLQQKDDDAELYQLRAMQYEARHNFQAALRDYSKALELDPSGVKFRLSRLSLNRRLKKNEDVLDDIDLLLGWHPGMFKLYIAKAEILHDMGNFKEAAKSMKKYIMYFPEDRDASFFASRINFDAGTYYTSLQYLNHLIKMPFPKKDYFYLRGLCYNELHTYSYAENDFCMALDLDPNDPEIYYNRGLARLSAGKNEPACYDFKKAFSMGEKKALQYLQHYCNY